MQWTDLADKLGRARPLSRALLRVRGHGRAEPKPRSLLSYSRAPVACKKMMAGFTPPKSADAVTMERGTQPCGPASLRSCMLSKYLPSCMSLVWLLTCAPLYKSAERHATA